MSSSDGTKLAAVVAGGHIYTSADTGKTWVDSSPASGAASGNLQWLSIASSADGAKLAAIIADGRVFTSSDSGTTWVDRTTVASSGNYTKATILSSADGKKLTALVSANEDSHFYQYELPSEP